MAPEAVAASAARYLRTKRSFVLTGADEREETACADRRIICH
jgi:hypothetical protein